MSNANYDIADIELAGEGYETSNWARRHMPVLESIRDRFEKEKYTSTLGKRQANAANKIWNGDRMS